jgi:hypothetical protein
MVLCRLSSVNALDPLFNGRVEHRRGAQTLSALRIAAENTGSK